ncbi:uncharacterized protein MONOS_14667 [Monocercomonoides exilis]|uniref:uncharacterized protein n=1 Tax=Monocercomonoides exilis TaxID=2049356 RepID=UPI00355A3E95|nr:hypothetical protein MONOS_14667 [Monocercomonoides exilis]|eukprot:MONOS_14667.1-p1 / transcript=MONOS_14667.1 / gene=MONOS_14667 / organism=Monocercomonoides_exilis_PA203 / gene_product=unspecified product / transcript_product=unspecified product / location=Mono_scaffold01045:5928-6209(+) / protein_length=94 / sequence_SO=supercontig / SO=protein_coding / is_pseudo=false
MRSIRGGNEMNGMNGLFLKGDVTAVMNTEAENVTANYSNNTETSEDLLIEKLFIINLIHHPVLVNASLKSEPPPFAEAASTEKRSQNSRHQMR